MGLFKRKIEVDYTKIFMIVKRSTKLTDNLYVLHGEVADSVAVGEKIVINNTADMNRKAKGRIVGIHREGSELDETKVDCGTAVELMVWVEHYKGVIAENAILCKD